MQFFWRVPLNLLEYYEKMTYLRVYLKVHQRVYVKVHLRVFSHFLIYQNLSANELAAVLDDDALVAIVHLNTAEVVCWCEIVVVASSSVDG